MNDFNRQADSSPENLFRAPVRSEVVEERANVRESVKEHPNPEKFLRLYLKHERRLQAFILSVLVNPSDADDVLQETVLILWQKFGEFEIGTDFLAWACRIAQFRVLKYYEKRRRSRVQFSPDVIEAVGEEVCSMGPLLDARHRALAGCLNELGVRDRDLLQRRYVHDASPREISGQVGRSVDAVYKALTRIRESLMVCIQRKLAGEG